MPSGAKKRKAAKKKKDSRVRVAPHPPNSKQPHSHGEEDLEQTYDKDSDGGDASSPASQDYHNCNELIDQEEEDTDKQDDGSSDHSLIHEHKSNEMANGGDEMEKGTIEEESDLHHAERVVRVEDEPQSMNISIEYIQPEGSLLRSLSSSSEDGSRAANKDNTVVDDTLVVDLVKEVDSLSAGKGNDVGTVFTTDLDKAAVSENEVEVKKSDELGLMQNGQQKTCVVDKSDFLSEDLVTMEAVQSSLDNEEGDTLTLSYNAPKIEASVGADPVKDSELSECSDSQYQNGLAIRPVHTSWKGCCGLFELFKGSDR